MHQAACNNCLDMTRTVTMHALLMMTTGTRMRMSNDEDACFGYAAYDDYSDDDKPGEDAYDYNR